MGDNNGSDDFLLGMVVGSAASGSGRRTPSPADQNLAVGLMGGFVAFCFFGLYWFFT